MRIGFDDKPQKDKRTLFCLLMLLLFCITNLFAQQTHNLQVIWTIPGNPVLMAYGYNLTSGDIDNDGHPDIIVSADTYLISGGNTPCRGRVYVYYGNHIGETIPDIVFKSPFAKGSTPTCVHSADLNGDGFDDIIMGEDQVEMGYGTVTIFWGGNPLDTIPDIILRGHRPLDGFFGLGISSGDVNGDSYDDLVVGAYGTYVSPAGIGAGRVYIYFGGPNFDTIPDVIINGGHHGQAECFGVTVGSGADVNGDGFDDLIVGAKNFSTGSFWGEGRIYIYYGGNPMDTSYDVAMLGEVPNQELGWTPKVNLLKTEFQYDMACFGSAFWPNGWTSTMNPGKVYVLFGGNPMDSIPDIWMIGRTESAGLGMGVSNAGYINQTNSEGIISGAPVEYTQIGTAYLWQGGSYLDTIPDGWLRGIQVDDDIGFYVASAGDVDGDGKDEVMVSNYPSSYTPKRVWVCKYIGTGIEENRQMLTVVRLPLEIYPNPARTQTAIRYSLTAKSKVSLKVYDVTGKLIKTFISNRELQPVGTYNVNWDLKDNNHKRVSDGIYFVEVGVHNKEETIKEAKKIMIAR